MVMDSTCGYTAMAESIGECVIGSWGRKNPSLLVYIPKSIWVMQKKREELRKQLQADLDPSAERKATILRKSSPRKFFRGCCP